MKDAGFVEPPAITYNSAGAGVTVTTGFLDIFTHSQKTECPVTSCTLKDSPGCSATSVVGAQTDVAIGGASPFAITAIETNAAGYSLKFCYECIVTPVGGGTPITFTKDSITVTQNALDCSTALTDAGFANPPAIPYNSVGTGFVVTTGFSDIFTHSQTTECPVTSCVLKDSPGCSSTSVVEAQTDVTIGDASPFSLTAIETNINGYMLTFCFYCTIGENEF